MWHMVTSPRIISFQKPKYTKKILKKASKPDRIPRKGDLVSCFYTGKLPDGTVFDTNLGKGEIPNMLYYF
jgi:FKBP-type peptidyl-prolyl cis-trans isomerase